MELGVEHGDTLSVRGDAVGVGALDAFDQAFGAQAALLGSYFMTDTMADAQIFSRMYSWTRLSDKGASTNLIRPPLHHNHSGRPCHSSMSPQLRRHRVVTIH